MFFKGDALDDVNSGFPTSEGVIFSTESGSELHLCGSEGPFTIQASFFIQEILT